MILENDWNPDPDILSSFYRLAPDLARAESPDEAIQRIMDTIAGWSDLKKTCLLVVDDNDQGWQCLYAYNCLDGEVDQISQFFKELDVSEPGQLVSDRETERSFVCVPLIFGNQITGLLYLERAWQAGVFRDQELATLNIIASQAAVFVENKRLQQAVIDVQDSKAKFLSVVTHELRIPMTSIRGYADLLRQAAVGPVNDMQVNFLNVIRNNVERMSALLTNLSDFSKLEANRLKLDLGYLHLRQVVGKAVEAQRPGIEEREQTLEVEVAADLPQVYADGARVEQLLINLINNASKYTSQGGEIRVVATQEGDRVRIRVIDNGIGISPSDQEMVFSAFFRSETPKVREEQGWGLALAVSKGLVELMNGEMGFESTLGEGSTFWFILPNH